MKKYPFVGKKCYDHIGGKLGAAMLDFFLKEGWLEMKVGTSTTYELTQRGREKFAEMGMELPQDIEE